MKRTNKEGETDKWRKDSAVARSQTGQEEQKGWRVEERYFSLRLGKEGRKGKHGKTTLKLEVWKVGICI